MGFVSGLQSIEFEIWGKYKIQGGDKGVSRSKGLSGPRAVIGETDDSGSRYLEAHGT